MNDNKGLQMIYNEDTGDENDHPFRHHPVKPLIIGLCGAIGSGKTTVASHLTAAHKFERVRFAEPLKRMMVSMLSTMGVDYVMAIRMMDGDLKEVASPLLCGRTPRHAMQTLGTEWGRGQMGEGFWTNAWLGAVQQACNRQLKDQRRALIVADDVRFPGEITLIRSLGGVIWRIERPGIAPTCAGHSSETALAGLEPDQVLVKSASIEALQECVDKALGTVSV